MNIGISILIYITYVVSNYSQSPYIVYLQVWIPLGSQNSFQNLCRIFLLSSQKSSYRPLLPLLYCLLFQDTLLYIYQIYPRLSDRNTTRNDRVSAILVQKWVSATVAEFESYILNAVILSSKPQPQGTFRLVQCVKHKIGISARPSPLCSMA